MGVPELASADEDVAKAAVPGQVRAAGVVLLMTGVFGALHVIQLFNVLTFVRGPVAAVPYLMAAESAGALVTGVALARARTWAPWAAIATAGLFALTSGAWFVFGLANGLVTLFGMLVPGLSVLALALAVVAKGPCEQASAARKRLERAGFDLGV